MVATANDGDGVAVEWQRIPADSVSPPIVRRVPYLELKLEHPELEPTGYGDQFYPDAVPYELAGTGRVFYWRPALATSTPAPADWRLACATTHELAGFGALPANAPALTTPDARTTTVVVAGTVGGDATTARLDSYAPPTIRLEDASESAVELTADERMFQVPAGERRRIPLAEQAVEPAGGAAGRTAVTQELVVRYPGSREIHHPARGASYRLFPSFGISLDDVPNPVPVPTTAGELDDSALATELGIDLADRPYPERVLWQAFAHTAFDPHADSRPELTQLPSGHFVVT